MIHQQSSAAAPTISNAFTSTLALLLLATACSSAAATPTAVPTAVATKAPTAVATVAGGSTNANRPRFTAAPPLTIDQSKAYTATFHTSDGDMVATLYAKEDPITVNNFVFLSQQGFYNGVIFHRIIKGFMVQSGDPLGNGTGGPGYQFKDEPVTRGYARGTLAMANSGPNTNGSQFFIVHQDTALPKNYTIFGSVTSGLDVLDKIANTPVTANPFGEVSKPTEQVTIQGIEIKVQ